jgi:hypothetical protein
MALVTFVVCMPVTSLAIDAPDRVCIFLAAEKQDAAPSGALLQRTPGEAADTEWLAYGPDVDALLVGSEAVVKDGRLLVEAQAGRLCLDVQAVHPTTGSRGEQLLRVEFADQDSAKLFRFTRDNIGRLMVISVSDVAVNVGLIVEPLSGSFVVPATTSIGGERDIVEPEDEGLLTIWGIAAVGGAVVLSGCAVLGLVLVGVKKLRRNRG